MHAIHALQSFFLENYASDVSVHKFMDTISLFDYMEDETACPLAKPYLSHYLTHFGYWPLI